MSLTDSRVLDRIEALEAAVRRLLGLSPRAVIRAGDVVLLGDGLGEKWTDCLGVVDEVKSWGLKVWVSGPERAAYPLRVEYSNVAKVFREIEAQSHPQRGTDSA